MTFASKYEILEPVTTGSVETFVARKLATDERVLVHIFECPEQRPDQPTVQWVLESFRAIASDPAELVLGTGKYSGTTYAYLVTKLPERAALEAWVRSYQARQEPRAAAAVDVSVSLHQSSDQSVEEPVHGMPMTAPAVSDPEPPLVAGISQALADSDVSSVSDSAPVQEQDKTVLFAGRPGEVDFGPAKVEEAEPGEFTRQFFPARANPGDEAAPVPTSSPTSESAHDVQLTPATGEGVSPEPKLETVSSDAPSDFSQVIPPAAGSPKEATASRDLVAPYEASQSKSSSDNVSANDDSAKTGEFTRFFQGPFHGERATKVPPVSTAWAQPKSEASEFTKVFGSARKTPDSEVLPSPRFTSEPSADLVREEVSHAMESAETPEAYISPGQQTEILEANLSKSAAFPDTSPHATVPRAPSVDPPQPTVRRFSSESSWHDADTAFMFRPKKEAATNAFAAHETESVAARSNLPSGPSEFTKIISGGLRNLESAEEGPAAAGPQDFIEKLGPPVIPSALPSFAAPSPAGQFPQAGSFPQAPMPPAIRTPEIPQVPQLGIAAPKVPSTPWTLILIMIGLFLIAVLVVLYFAFKH